MNEQRIPAPSGEGGDKNGGEAPGTVKGEAEIVRLDDWARQQHRRRQRRGTREPDPEPDDNNGPDPGPSAA